MTTETSAAPAMAYVPGSTRFSYRAQERRTATYRTWYSAQIGWCWECLLCGEWRSSHDSREDAARKAGEAHPTWCHVVTGCHCYWPHITAAMAARLGISEEYPRHLARVLFRLAGGQRKPVPPPVDKYGARYACGHCDNPS